MTLRAGEARKRKILSEVALGSIAPDTVLTHGAVFNSFTGEFIKDQSIWIKHGRIAYVGPDHDPPRNSRTELIDADGMVLLPGLIEGHTHLNRSGIEEFIKHVIPGGVTTVVMETMELGMIFGKKGIEYFIKGLEKQPIRFYYTLAALCGLTLSTEVKAPGNQELLPLLKDPNCLGIGEIYWGNAFSRGKQGRRVRELASLGVESGKRVEGHGAGAAGRKLQAYTCLGPSSDHEPTTKEEVLERLRLGHWVMIREGSVRKELPGVKDIFKERIDFRRLILTTDGVDPVSFIEEGYLEAALRRALKLGVPPALAYQMVTINVAEHFHLDHLIGSLSPGKMADLVMIPAPDEFSPQLVMCNGKVILKEGEATVAPRKATFPKYMFHSIKFPQNPIPSPRRKGKVRVIELVTDLVTKEGIVDLENPGESKDLLMLLAIDRVAQKGAFMGFLKGFGLQSGAYGSTMFWDSVDTIVVGSDLPSMETVLARLKEIGGGAVYAIGKERVAEFRASLGGVYSQKPMEVLRDEMKHLEGELKRNGVRWEKPMLTIDILGTPAIPHLRITHQGYVRLRDRQVLGVEVKE
jgi:adenine deaminase